jgi:hypothetical protein
VSGPYRERSCFPPWRRPDAATWPTVRDVRQRVEPDIRPLSRVAPAFIVEEARRLSSWQVMCRLSIKYALSTPLTSNVPSQHLMCPVHSADGRRAHPLRWRTVHLCCGIHCAHHHSYVASEASAPRQYYAGCKYQGARRLHWQPALVAPSATSVMSLGPHVGA